MEEKNVQRVDDRLVIVQCVGGRNAHFTKFFTVQLQIITVPFQ